MLFWWRTFYRIAKEQIVQEDLIDDLPEEEIFRQGQSAGVKLSGKNQK